MNTNVRAHVSMWIDCRPEQAYGAFVRPDALTSYWLGAASAPLEVGHTVHWTFVESDVTATRLDPEKAVEWDFADGSHVRIDFEPVDGGTAVTLINDRFRGDQVSEALNATEGFAFVLADLKTWLESGATAGITRSKAKLIELRR